MSLHLPCLQLCFCTEAMFILQPFKLFSNKASVLDPHSKNLLATGPEAWHTMDGPAGKKARRNEPVAKAKAAEAKKHVIPHKIFVKFTDELFKLENCCCYDHWIGHRSDWGDDPKLQEYEQAHDSGTTAAFWQKWKTEVSQPELTPSSSSRA